MGSTAGDEACSGMAPGPRPSAGRTATGEGHCVHARRSREGPRPQKAGGLRVASLLGSLMPLGAPAQGAMASSSSGSGPCLLPDEHSESLPVKAPQAFPAPSSARPHPRCDGAATAPQEKRVPTRPPQGDRHSPGWARPENCAPPPVSDSRRLSGTNLWRSPLLVPGDRR